MSTARKSKILIVGGAGFIGSCLAGRLIDKGYKDIVVFDNFSTGNAKMVPAGCSVVKGDIRNEKDLNSLPKGIEYVFHLAAATAVDESFVKPEFYFQNNVLGTIKLLDWCQNNKIRKIIYSSSAAVYGNVDESVVMKEDLLPDPVNYYGLTKLDGEFIVRMNNFNYGLDYAILRYFNVFGEAQDCLSSYASVIPKFIYAAFSGKELTIYGSGKQTRDFIHVDEVADATILAMEKGKGIYNVATAEQYDINTISRLILKHIKTDSRIVYLPPVPGDTMRDNSCIDRLLGLGWSRKRTFEEWLRRTIDWYRKWASENRAANA